MECPFCGGQLQYKQKHIHYNPSNIYPVFSYICSQCRETVLMSENKEYIPLNSTIWYVFIHWRISYWSRSNDGSFECELCSLLFDMLSYATLQVLNVMAYKDIIKNMSKDTLIFVCWLTSRTTVITLTVCSGIGISTAVWMARHKGQAGFVKRHWA